MPERRPAAFACEDDARAALLAARARRHRRFGCKPCRLFLDALASQRQSRPARRDGSRGPRRRARRVSPGFRCGMQAQARRRRRRMAPAPRALPRAHRHRGHRSLPADLCHYARLLEARSGRRHPAFHPDVTSAAGGAIAFADCGLPGAALQSEPVLAALRDRWACLLAGWGLLACGASLPAAVGPRCRGRSAGAHLVACPAARVDQFARGRSQAP